MQLLDRDALIVRTVGSFRQLDAGQLHELCFDGLSQTPKDRALRRLVELNMLALVPRETKGGTGAGSMPRVYQLGSAGWALLGREGRYYKYRAVNYHTLAIVDAYIDMIRRTRESHFEIDKATTEPETRTVIGGVELRPDLFLQVSNPIERTRVQLFLEIDLGTERDSVIRAKLRDYWNAYKGASEYFPRVVFLAPDTDRAKRLKWVVEQASKEAQALFLVSTIKGYSRIMFG